MEPERLLIENVDLLKRVVRAACAHRQILGADADDVLGEVTLHLIRNDFHALRIWQGRAKLSTYLTVVAYRVIEDLQRQRPSGRWRPSEQAKRLGPVAIEIEALHYRDHRSWEETLREVTVVRGCKLSREEFGSIAQQLPVRVVPRVECDSGLDLQSDFATPEHEASVKELGQEGDRVAGTLSGLVNALDPEDRLVLYMLYWKGVTVAALARMLGVEQKAMYHRRDRLLHQLRDDLGEAGIEPGTLATALEALSFSDGFESNPSTLQGNSAPVSVKSDDVQPAGAGQPARERSGEGE
jgi:RNA polymerase sigma factor (sigma-70 family)